MPEKAVTGATIADSRKDAYESEGEITLQLGAWQCPFWEPPD